METEDSHVRCSRTNRFRRFMPKIRPSLIVLASFALAGLSTPASAQVAWDSYQIRALPTDRAPVMDGYLEQDLWGLSLIHI